MHSQKKNKSVKLSPNNNHGNGDLIRGIHKGEILSIEENFFVSGDVLRTIYAGMLFKYGPDIVRKFWVDNRPPAAEEDDGEAGIFKYLWSNKQAVTFGYFIKTINNLELFLSTYKFDVSDFITKALVAISRGIIIPPREALLLFGRRLDSFLDGGELRMSILKTIPFFTSMLAPGIVHEIIDEYCDEKSGRLTVIMLMMLGDKRSGQGNYRHVFAAPLPEYDGDLWIADIVRQMPVGMGIEPYEEKAMICDSRQVRTVVPDMDIVEQSDKVFINGEFAAQKVPFHDFCQKFGFNPARYEIPAQNVYVMNKAVKCPQRNRTVLYKNCAYGAPVCMYRIGYDKLKTIPKNFLKGYIDDAAKSIESPWEKIRLRHEKLVRDCAPKRKIVYYRSDERIAIDDTHFMRGTPAKIFRRMISAYVNERRDVFENREFVKDDDIVLDPLNPNITIRIQRLEQRLRERLSCIRMERAGRGKVKLEVLCDIDYCESP